MPSTIAKPAPSAARASDDQTPAELRRLFLNHPTGAVQENTKSPHKERLLNDKATRFSDFSHRMLAQLLAAMLKIEKQKPMVRMELPSDLKPVIVTAVLNDKGQLHELIFIQHSGVAAVDNLVIEACKGALWAGALPDGAADKDGNYRLRIEAKLRNYSADRKGNQIFMTRLALGIL